MKRILLIDNTFDPPHGSPEIKAHLERCAAGLGAVEVTAVRAPEGKIPLELQGFDGAVLSGSKTRIAETAPWIEKEMEAIRRLVVAKVPTLGICYGEQLIARTLGGDHCTGVAREDEHGWVELELKSSSPILEGLSQKFYSFEYHRDEVCALPANFRLTASSAACTVQAFDLEDAPVWGLQFHPERGLEEGKKSLERKLREDPAFRAINHEKADAVFDPAVAQTIFRNFLKQVWRAG